MSYTKKTWKNGDTITAADLNNIEEGTSANASAIEKIEQSLTTYVGADVPRKAAETITPGTENQTIAANQYLTGAQTIKGDGNLSAGNIKKGVSIFGVIGTLEAGSSGGMVSKSGTVTGGGSGAATVIATWLSNVALLALTVDGVAGLGFVRGYYCEDWGTGAHKRGRNDGKVWNLSAIHIHIQREQSYRVRIWRRCCAGSDIHKGRVSDKKYNL